MIKTTLDLVTWQATQITNNFYLNGPATGDIDRVADGDGLGVATDVELAHEEPGQGHVKASQVSYLKQNLGQSKP